MGTNEVKLLGFWCSPFVFRVEWALKLKGIEYEFLEEDIFNKSSRLLELNPVYKKVPVFVHDKKVINDSYLILEYIDETWHHPNPLLPQDPYERAMARFWAKFADEKMESACRSMWTKADEKQSAVTETIEALEKIEGELKGKSYFGGESIGYLDIAIGWISYWLPVWEEIGSIQILDSEKFPAIAAWKSKFLNHPVIKEALPPRDKMLSYFHKRCKDWATDVIPGELAETKLQN